MLPQDYYVHSFNLTEANLTPDKNPDWKMWLDYRKEYNMTDLSPRSLLDKITTQIFESQDMANLYRLHSIIDASGAHKNMRGVDCTWDHCRSYYYCDTMSNDIDELDSCMKETNNDWIDYLNRGWFKNK